jgi:hypothetical protein
LQSLRTRAKALNDCATPGMRGPGCVDYISLAQGIFYILSNTSLPVWIKPHAGGDCMRTKTALVAALMCIAASNVFAKDVATADLKKLFVLRIEAFSKIDTVALMDLCTKDYQLVNSVGTKMNINEVMQNIASQNKQIKSYVILTFQPFVAEDESMAFAISEVSEEILQGETITKNNLIVTEIYRKIGKKWKIQLTQIAQKICNYP